MALTSSTAPGDLGYSQDEQFPGESCRVRLEGPRVSDQGVEGQPTTRCQTIRGPVHHRTYGVTHR